jgi:Ca2+-transporting ATPase
MTVGGRSTRTVRRCWGCSPASSKVRSDARSTLARALDLGYPKLGLIRFEETVAEAARLGTDVARGIDVEQVAKSRLAHGDNRLPEPRRTSVLALFLESLQDRTLMILMAAAALAIGVEGLRARLETGHQASYYDGIAILCAVLIASLVTTINQARAAKEFRDLSKEREDVPVKVLREGHVRASSIHELVVGDICYLSTGDGVPADGLLLSAVDLTVDESLLSGESLPVAKTAEERELRAGSTVSTGHGAMLVTAVGAKTEMGRLQLSLQNPEAEPTPLQVRLSELADKIGLFGLSAALLTFLALTVSGFARGQLHLGLGLGLGAKLLEFVILAVTMVVVAVPEGLPLAVTISLAYSVRRMAADKNLVRKLASCETMGAATVICSDKTGTLTQNRMAVERLWIGGHWTTPNEAVEVLGAGSLDLLAELGAINSTAFLERKAGGLRYVGNPTEAAILAEIERWGRDSLQLRVEADVVVQYGFSSERKRMSTLIRRAGGGERLLVKGAPEVVLERAVAVLGADGAPHALDPAARSPIEAAIHEMAERGYRTLGFAYRDWPETAVENAPEEVEESLVFVGLVAIADPLRPDVREAVARCRGAGVEVKMLTGDHRMIATSVAEGLAMMTPGDRILEGPEFRAMSDQDALRVLPQLRVLARSAPSDKLRLVTLLKKSGEVVAVTGDGTNDAPALKFADVGFSMGTGTEVAKQASDIVILDDNFASIVKAIQWGRSVFENIRKFLQFQLTVNVVALATALSAAILGYGIPLNTVQLLWVNLLMDTLAALALAVEPPRAELLSQAPHGRHAPLITRAMWLNVFAMATVMFALLMVTLATDLVVPLGTPEPERLTFVFNAFVLMQLFNEINARTTRFDRSPFAGILDSRLFLAVVGGTSVIQVLIIQFGGQFFRTVPIGPELWLRSVLLGATMLLAGAVTRALARRIPGDWYGARRVAPAVESVESAEGAA